MKATWLLLLCSALWFAPTISRTQDPGEVRLSVAGLQVIRDKVPSSHPVGFDLTPFSSFEDRGVKIALMLSAPAGEIAAFDYRNCGVSQLADDRGNPLRITPIDFMATKIAENRRHALVEVSSPGLPARGANAIKAKGAIGVLYGSRTVTARSEPADIEKGAVIKAGNYEFRVGEIKVTRKQVVTYRRVQLSLKGTAPEIRSLQFQEKRENGFKGTPNTGSGGDRDETTFYFRFEGELPRAVILTVEKWSDLRPIQIPFDIEVGAGL